MVVPRLCGDLPPREKVQRERKARYQAQIAGCDPDIIRRVECWEDIELVKTLRELSGLSIDVFLEEVLHWNSRHYEHWIYGGHQLPLVLRRALVIQTIKILHRARHGTLPDESWCPCCGRGIEHVREIQSPTAGMVLYVYPPEFAEELLIMGHEMRSVE